MSLHRILKVGGIEMNNNYDITGNIKIIEWIKAELLSMVASLYRIIAKGVKISEDTVSDCIAGIIILSYLLARRLGVEFSAVDSKVESKLRVGVLEEDSLEKEYGDLSRLLSYMKDRK